MKKYYFVFKIHNLNRCIGNSAHTWASSPSLIIYELSVGEWVVPVACCYPSSRRFPGVNLSSIFVSIFLLGVLDSTPLLTSLFTKSEQVKFLFLFFQTSVTRKASLKLICNFEKWPPMWGTELAWRLFPTFSSDDQEERHKRP